MKIVWYKTVIDGVDMRYPFDLESRSIDWLHGERYTEPPLRTVIPRNCKRCHRHCRKHSAAQARKIKGA